MFLFSLLTTKMSACDLSVVAESDVVDVIKRNMDVNQGAANACLNVLALQLVYVMLFLSYAFFDFLM